MRRRRAWRLRGFNKLTRASVHILRYWRRSLRRRPLWCLWNGQRWLISGETKVKLGAHKPGSPFQAINIGTAKPFRRMTRSHSKTRPPICVGTASRSRHGRLSFYLLVSAWQQAGQLVGRYAVSRQRLARLAANTVPTNSFRKEVRRSCGDWRGSPMNCSLDASTHVQSNRPRSWHCNYISKRTQPDFVNVPFR